MITRTNTGMPELPKFITFTGADDKTDVNDMAELSKEYPIEWGILFSPKRTGESRYPTVYWISTKLLDRHKELNLSAHIFGGDTRTLFETGTFKYDLTLQSFFDRAQINTASKDIPYDLLSDWSVRNQIIPILQTRDEFNGDPRFYWLFDKSGGRGERPEYFPLPCGDTLRGYAGGLNPDNVADAVLRIGYNCRNYWLDMESGVRDENGDFSIDMCRQVCESVYRDSPPCPTK